MPRKRPASQTARTAQRPPKPTASTPIEVRRIEGAETPTAGRRATFEMVLLVKGTATRRAGKLELRVKAGDLVLLGPGDLPGPCALDKAEGFRLLFADEFVPHDQRSKGMAELLSEVRSEPLQASIPKEERATYRRRLLELERELEERKPDHLEAARGHLTVLLIETARFAQPVRALVTSIPILGRVFRALDEKVLRPLSLHDVAETVSRSPSMLTDLVSGTERRMAEARRLLLETDEDVPVIAARVRYANVDQFARQFSRLHGMSPEAFRRSRRS